MNSSLKIPSPWSQLALFLCLMGGALILTSLVISVVWGIQAATASTGGVQKLIQTISTVLFIGLPAFFYARLTFTDRPLYYLGFRPALKWNFYLLGVLLLLFAFPLEGWLGVLNKQLPLPHWMIQEEQDKDRQVSAILQAKNSFDVVINLLVVAVIPGIFEEMCFRGVLQRICMAIFRNAWGGIILSAIIFSAFHLQFQGFLPRMFLGILLGAAYWYSGSLWTSILAHIFFNGIQVLAATWYPAVVNNDANPSIPASATLISLVIVVGLLAAMRRQSIQTRPSDPNFFEWH